MVRNEFPGVHDTGFLSVVARAGETTLVISGSFRLMLFLYSRNLNHTSCGGGCGSRIRERYRPRLRRLQHCVERVDCRESRACKSLCNLNFHRLFVRLVLGLLYHLVPFLLQFLLLLGVVPGRFNLLVVVGLYLGNLVVRASLRVSRSGVDDIVYRRVRPISGVHETVEHHLIVHALSLVVRSAILIILAVKSFQFFVHLPPVFDNLEYG